ncbi:MAG: nucleotidyltransferase family protein [Caulobacter sp.]|nr:nucleotidyltransferase family protein [Caulobacter sp.]
MTLQEALDTLRAAKPLLDQYGVARIGVFGSVARGEAGPDSDVDVLVEFKPDRHPGLEFFTLRDRLAAILGTDVDLATSRTLHRLMRDRVLKEVTYA